MRYSSVLFGLVFLAPTVLAADPAPYLAVPGAPVAAVSEDPVAVVNGGSPAPLQGGPAQDDDTLLSGNHNFPNFIGFLGNPLQNIDPRAVTEIYPIFASAWTTEAGPVPRSDFQLYGAGLTVALSDRFAVGLNQGGYADVHLSRKERDRLALLDPLGRFRDVEAGGNRSGWLNLGGFFQYTLIQDVPDQFLLTGGLRLEAPCGSHDIFQGHGPAHLAPYLTAGKELGHFHVLATTGYEFPAGPGSDTTNLFYANLHLDRQTFGWLYPLVEFDWTYHVTSVGLDRPAARGFFDLDNFEASGNIVTVAAGADAVLIRERLEFGAVYSTPLATQRDFNFNGLLVRMVYRY